MKFFLKTAFLILLILQLANTGLIPNSTIQKNSKIIEKEIDQSKSYTINVGEDYIIAKYQSAESDIYEINLKPLKGDVKDSKNEICFAVQPEIIFTKHSKSFQPVFTDYFDNNGFLNDVTEKVPVLIDYVRTKDGIIALDSKHNLHWFVIQNSDGRYYLEKSTTHSLLSEIDQGIPQDEYPTLTYTYMYSDSQEKQYIYLIYTDVAFYYDPQGETKFTKMDNWVPIKKLYRAEIQYGYGLKEMKTLQNFKRNAQLFVAAGYDGFYIYNIIYGEIQLQPPKKFTELQSGKTVNIVNFSHNNFETNVFVLDAKQGVRKIKMNQYSHGSGENLKWEIQGNLETIEKFHLEVQQGQYIVHFSRYADTDSNPIVNQSFVIVSQIQRNQYITEFDYSPQEGTWWQADRQKYNWHFEIKNMIIEKNYVLLMGSHFTKTMRHSIYHLFTERKHHEMTKQEQLDETIDNTLVIPGLVKADFLWNDYDNQEEEKLLNYKYIVGITAHEVVLYNVGSIPAHIRCSVSSNVKPGVYNYEVSLYETSCIDEENQDTYNDYIACRHSKAIAVEVEKLIEKNFPWWAILLIILGILLVVGGCVFGGIKIYRARKLEQGQSKDLENKENQVVQKENEAKKAKYEIMDEDEED